GLVQPGKQPGPPELGSTGGEPLATRYHAGTVGQMLGAQQLAADRPGDQFVGAGRPAREQAGEERWRCYGSDVEGLGWRRRVKLIPPGWERAPIAPDAKTA
ncbi:MAG: hypothetical protein ACRDJK_14645, partial [Actinomycetota bacterium]